MRVRDALIPWSLVFFFVLACPSLAWAATAMPAAPTTATISARSQHHRVGLPNRQETSLTFGGKPALAIPPPRTTPIGTNPTGTTPSLTCLLNSSCLTQQVVDAVSQVVADQLLQALNPLILWIVNDPLNIISQTSATLTYQNVTVQTIVQFSLGAVDTALAIVVIVAGYNLMLGEQLGIGGSRLAEFIPRFVLAVIAAHSSLLFVQWLIDLNNVLCLSLIQLTSLTILTQTVKSILTGTLGQAGLLLFLFGLVVLVLTLLFAWQMLVRLAFLLFLISVAPLGMLCFALPQTQGWGRLWLSNLTTTVFVQFFQVTVLSIGGMLVAHLLPGTDGVAGVIELLMSSAVFFLALRLPGMLRQWALHREAGQAASAVGEALAGIGAAVPRILALL